MLGSSTHDTKRSEDVRARLAVLAELATGWRITLRRWHRMNQSKISPSDEYHFYQALTGIWPGEVSKDLVERLKAYMLKAAREAKERTSWINPDTEYEATLEGFVAQSLENRAFVKDVKETVARVAHLGLLVGLSQALVKVASPGVPDYYQGTELWDFSLVDPDNRRPVDYAGRHRLLQKLQTHLAAAGDDRLALAQELLTRKEDGRIKLYVIALALHCRRRNPGLFAVGDYVPAQVLGAKGAHVFGFSRRQGDQAAIVAVPRLIARLLANGHQAPLGEAVWQDTRLRMPGINPQQTWRHVFTGEPVRMAMEDGQPTLAVADLMAQFPVALLMAQPEERA
jgi:(1->4)-alpha-D-glucan 1-alpha-D-glucosylmutase